jgi:uncharacterized membrane protein (DUF4010 family)
MIAGFEWTVELRFALALALGFLVGLERESTKEHQKLVFGGVRTHPIISLLGFGAAWLYQYGATFVLPAGLLALGGLTVVAYVAKIREERFGTTSEISALLTYVTGALALLADIWIAMAAGIVNAMLLSEKARLETYVEHLNRAEFLATLKFLLVTVIILPVLPNQEYTAFHLNPAAIWKLVIIVSAVGFIGYVLIRRLGARVGLWLSGLLGGIVSSTALTWSMGRLAQRDGSRSAGALQAAIFAGAVMYLRILVILAIVAPAMASLLWWKLVILSLVGLGLALSVRAHEGADADRNVAGLENPFELTPALIFAGLYVALTVLTSLARSYAGETGVLTLAAFTGFVDIDPFILSLVGDRELAMGIIVGGIILAMLSNTLAKGIYFSVLVPSSRRAALLRYAGWAVVHLPFVFLF